MSSFLRRSLTRTSGIFLLLVTSVMVTAERLPDLYRYSTLVASSSKNSQEYRQALGDGFAEVILRSSGDPATLQNDSIVEALGRPTRYLLTDYFENSNEVIEIDGREVPARRLVLEFSGEGIERLLRELGLPIWPNNRRSVLLWLVVDDAQGQRVVSEVNFPEALAAAKSSTKRRGLPVILPLMDLEDQVALSPNQLWTVAQDPIQQASQRYNPDTILVGRLRQTSRGEWLADWQLLTDNGFEVFDGQNATIEGAVANGVDQVANYFFQRYGINPQLSSGGGVLLFQVGNIRDFADYKKVLDYLQGLTAIRRVDLVAVRDDSLLLYLTADGGVQLLQDTFALDKKLVARNGFNNSAPLGSVENPLLYAWQ